jgi:uncharacterized membrane protein
MEPTWRMISLYGMAALYIGAGINHFIHPNTYYLIMPPWLPLPMTLVIMSGVFEIVGGLLLLPAVTRKAAAWFIVLLLIAIFPANIQMMLNYYRADNHHFWLTVLRLPLQLVLIWWAWTFTKE